ncbi:transporter substrate-binding domain-containing protein [Undibacterium sp. TS12]|uniref:substrate-binding periplasmic protein n=1 Tax=Undibacterium sp. TS12 TaxID=2908202 RepID=UPI001F4C86E9|nr:transporter substrate-binding domain-containing protein [Undibacterium sp. TS12]MCH8618305.1 transporter substrate-binding domain-containing protein [Undibacterium sp. TS12]
MSVRFFRYIFIMLLCLPGVSLLAADKPVMNLASLEWSPYVGSHLPDEGLTSVIVKSAAIQAGIDTHISYTPWSRAVQLGLNDPGYAGYFPAFYLKEREKTCYFSAPLGNSIVGFAYLKDRHFDWKNYTDLKGLTIGVVQDYANGEEFDAEVRKEQLRLDVAPSDISNLRKLMAGRVDLAIVGKDVLRQLLITEPSLKPGRDSIVFHPREVTNFSMHICFQRNRQGLKYKQMLDPYLEKLNLRKIENLYFQQMQNSQP